MWRRIALPAATAASEAILMAGIQEVSNALVSDFKLNDVLRIILETIYRAKGFKRVILCIREGAQQFDARSFRFWSRCTGDRPRFRFSLVFTPDIFHAALAKGVDILISDTNDPKISARIPEWFRKAVAAETFRRFSALHQGECGGHDLCRPGRGRRDRDFRKGAVLAENPAQSGGAGDQAAEVGRAASMGPACWRDGSPTRASTTAPCARGRAHSIRCSGKFLRMTRSASSRRSVRPSAS
jgi:hypothetical protein